MEFSPRAAELTTLLESRMTNFYTNFQVDEIGRVVSVGDGIARVYGLNEIQAGEMVEFASGVKGIALNLENENVGIASKIINTIAIDTCHGLLNLRYFLNVFFLYRLKRCDKKVKKLLILSITFFILSS